MLQLHKALKTILHDMLWQLIFHSCRRGAWARGILEGISRREARTAHNIHGALEIFFSLSWEANDDIRGDRSEEHTSELQSRGHLVCRLLLEKKKQRDQSV